MTIISVKMAPSPRTKGVNLGLIVKAMIIEPKTIIGAPQKEAQEEIDPNLDLIGIRSETGYQTRCTDSISLVLWKGQDLIIEILGHLTGKSDSCFR